LRGRGEPWTAHRIAGAIGAALLLVGALISVNVARQPTAEAAVDLPAGWVTNAVVSGLV